MPEPKLVALPAPSSQSKPRRRRRRVKVDWEVVAMELAGGSTVAHAASVADCARSTIWRHLAKPSPLRTALERERALRVGQAESRMNAMAGMVASSIAAHAHNGNLRVLLWLADRLKITQRGYLNTLTPEIAVTQAIIEAAGEREEAAIYHKWSASMMRKIREDEERKQAQTAQAGENVRPIKDLE